MAKRRTKTLPPPAGDVSNVPTVTPPAETPARLPEPPEPPEPSAPAAEHLEPANDARTNDSPKFVDPIAVQSVALTAGNGGPKMRLLRSNQYQQMRIRFDEKPPEAVRERLHADGWRWRAEEQAWTKQLDRASRWRTHADAERLFREIADGVRAGNGLPPAADLGRA